MKARIICCFSLLAIVLISGTNSLSYEIQETLHENHELPKLCQLSDGGVLVLSSEVGNQKCKMSELDIKGRSVKDNSTMDYGYTGSAQVVQPHPDGEKIADYLLFYHNKQNLENHEAKENMLSFKSLGKVTSNYKRKNSLFKTMSAVSLQNGKVVIAGINPVPDGGQTSIEVDIYDPYEETWGTGITFTDTYSKYISCYEQNKNNVYCVYVSYEDVFVTKLKISHLYVENNSLLIKKDKVIKSFYTEFNFLKAIPFNNAEAVVLFQSGNTENPPPYGNSGKDLFFYHLRVSETEVVTVRRYEFLFNGCKYVEDPEDYNADIIVLSQKRIYVACETEENKFKGFFINPEEKKILNFNFNNFNAATVKNPVFAKFDKSIGLFYTQQLKSGTNNVAFMMINYPDCSDYRITVLLPKHFQTEVDLFGRVFMNNPYPANRASEKINYRINDNVNLKIINSETNEEILNDVDYDPEKTRLRFISDSKDGKYSIDFTSTRNDDLDGLILGRTCKINFDTPVCLPQCYSCTKKGNEEHHYCLGCADGSYYEEKDDSLTEKDDEGYGMPHNCKNCDIACTTCYGKYILPPDPETTNCIKCDYSSGYYHYEYDNRTCISYNTQEKWEKIYKHAIYLDKSAGENNKEKWRWKHCHDNCKKCHGPGTKEDNQCDECIDDFYFYCNQTIGHGIPGSCHNDCINNGYFLKKNASDNMDKCCPCLDDCKVCKNETICEECFDPFYKTPEWDRCNATCNSCLAYDDDLKECVFCKTRYEKTGMSPRYNYKQKCYYPMPEKYHLIDDICYNITICDGGCFTCEPEGSDQCTKCKADFFKEDFFGLPPKKTFRCFNKTQCQGIDKYPPEKSLRVGGVPIKEDGLGVCLNCKLRNDSFRLPENDFYCSDVKIKKTFIDIEDYNKLSYCYLRCKECDDWGNACFMNCTSCLDSANYDLILYDSKRGTGNCVRKKHHCGIYPYYHDYDLAKYVGKSEDNCGQECDVCLKNFTCTDKFPYFNLETHECVEYCPIVKVLGNQCNLSNPYAAIDLFKNPFGTRDIFDPLSSSTNIYNLYKTDFWKYIIASYDIDEKTAQNIINNYLKEGKIFNLPQSQIIFGNNISIEITTTKLQKELLDNITRTPHPEQPPSEPSVNRSIIDLSECEKIIKKRYKIPEEEELLLFKADFPQEKINKSDYLSPEVNYQLFSISMGCFFPLEMCDEEETTVTVFNPFDINNLITQYQSKIDAVISNGYDVFDTESPFYNDVCSPFTNENGNDVLLEERKSDYFNENLNLCEQGCTFIGYNVNAKMYTCRCPIKTKVGTLDNTDDYETITKEIPESFYKKHKHSNIEVFKCSSQVFSSKGQKLNFGSYFLLTSLGSFIGLVIYYFIKGKESVNLLFASLPSNPPKIKERERDYDDFVNKNKKNTKNVQKDIVLEDEELNSACFTIAIKQDNRTYIQYYWSLLKMKQLFIFTFYTYKDHNLRIAKVALFILFISFYFAFTALFFNDSIMREIYTYKGNTNAAIHIPNIVLSSICCLIMNFIVRFVSLSDRDISLINNEKNTDNRSALIDRARRLLKIKLYIIFAVAGILITLCWYYVAAFCAVFKNSQGHYFINLTVAFLVCNIWPCVTSLIPPIFRYKGLNDGSECMYKFSQIIAYI
jgi:hypothetical protein